MLSQNREPSDAGDSTDALLDSLARATSKTLAVAAERQAPCTKGLWCLRRRRAWCWRRGCAYDRAMQYGPLAQWDPPTRLFVAHLRPHEGVTPSEAARAAQASERITPMARSPGRNCDGRGVPPIPERGTYCFGQRWACVPQESPGATSLFLFRRLRRVSYQPARFDRKVKDAFVPAPSRNGASHRYTLWNGSGDRSPLQRTCGGEQDAERIDNQFRRG